MTLVDQPWVRVKQPTVLPLAPDRDLVADLPSDQLAAMLRDHLIPSGAAGSERAVWDRFWAVLHAHDDLAERAFDVLEDFLDQVEDALEAAGPEHPQRRRMQKFQLNAENAVARLDREPAVRGTRGSRLDHSRLESERATALRETRLFGAAIAAHRDATEYSGRGFTVADLELWAVLDGVEDRRVAAQTRLQDRR